MGIDVPDPASVIVLGSTEKSLNWLRSALAAALMADCRALWVPVISDASIATVRSLPRLVDRRAGAYEFTSTTRSLSDVMLCDDHGVLTSGSTRDRVPGAPLVATSEGLNEVVSVARVMKGLLAKPLKTSFMKATDALDIGPTITTVRVAAASGASKCKNASVPNVSAARRPAPIDVSVNSVESGPSELSALSPATPAT